MEFVETDNCKFTSSHNFFCTQYVSGWNAGNLYSMVATSTKSKSLFISASLARKISSLTVATSTRFSSQIVATSLFVGRLLKLSTLKLY